MWELRRSPSACMLHESSAERAHCGSWTPRQVAQQIGRTYVRVTAIKEHASEYSRGGEPSVGRLPSRWDIVRRKNEMIR